MLKKYIFLILFSLFWTKAAFAQVVISEIMYDLDGADIDFVEVKNEGNSDADLTALKLLISNSTSNHAINNYAGSPVLHAGDFGVIVVNSSISNYVSKWGSAGNIFTASFSLPNTGGQVEINNGDKNSPIDSVAYSSEEGAAGDGKSLQKIDGSFTAAGPTPGLTNVAGSEDEDSGSDSDDGSDDSGGDGSDGDGSGNPSSNGSGSTETPVNLLKPKAEIKGPKTVFTKVPAVFEPNVVNLEGKEARRGKFVWNFGDGSTLELGENKKAGHLYDYPGDYVVALSYYPSVLSALPDLETRLSVKVMEPGVVISRTGEAGDFFVELFNNAKYEINLSGWILNSQSKSFYVPANTILMSGKKIIFSPRVTGFVIEDKDSLKLLFSNGQVAYNFISSPPSPPPAVVSAVKVKTPSQSPPYQGEKAETPSLTREGVGGGLEPEKLSAQAIKSIPENNSKLLYLAGLAGLIILGISSVFLFKRQNPTPPNPADDFEIME